MEASVRRPWQINVVAIVVLAWCAGVWLGVLYLLGVAF